MDTTQLKEFAQLAEASYADFSSGYSTGAVISKLTESPNGAFALTQAAQLDARYSVLDQFKDASVSNSNGFSATVFQDRANPNRLVLSFRGTEFEGDKFNDLALTDSQIGIVGYALKQAVPMYRYIKQLQTNGGQAVSYTEAEMERLFYLNGGSQAILLPAVASQYASFKADLLTDKGIGTGTPILKAGMEIDLAGHSLGGHLAMLAQRLFPGRFDDVVTANAVGFYAPPFGVTAMPAVENILSMFGQWDNSKIVRMESVGDGVSELARVYPGTTMTVGMETYPVPLNSFGNNHSVANIADGLALTEAIGKLDARYMADPRLINTLLQPAPTIPYGVMKRFWMACEILLAGQFPPRLRLTIPHN